MQSLAGIEIITVAFGNNYANCSLENGLEKYGMSIKEIVSAAVLLKDHDVRRRIKSTLEIFFRGKINMI